MFGTNIVLAYEIGLDFICSCMSSWDAYCRTLRPHFQATVRLIHAVHTFLIQFYKIKNKLHCLDIAKFSSHNIVFITVIRSEFSCSCVLVNSSS